MKRNFLGKKKMKTEQSTTFDSKADYFKSELAYALPSLAPIYKLEETKNIINL